MKNKVYTECKCGGKLLGTDNSVLYTAPLKVNVRCNKCNEFSRVFVDDNEEYLEEQSLMGTNEED